MRDSGPDPGRNDRGDSTYVPPSSLGTPTSGGGRGTTGSGSVLRFPFLLHSPSFPGSRALLLCVHPLLQPPPRRGCRSETPSFLRFRSPLGYRWDPQDPSRGLWRPTRVDPRTWCHLRGPRTLSIGDQTVKSRVYARLSPGHLGVSLGQFEPLRWGLRV